MQLSGQATSVTVTGALDTELAPALALTDAMANPTTPFLGAGALLWNGTGWDRERGDIANGLDVDVTRLPALVAGSAVIGHVIVDSAGSVAITSLPALPAGTNVIGHVILDSGTVTVQNVVGSGLYIRPGTGVNLDTSAVAITSALPAGSNVLGHVIVDSAGSVVVTSLPALPAGANVIGHVIVDSAGSVVVTTLPALVAGEAHIGEVGGHQKHVSASFNRPADTSIYTAKDVVSNSISATTMMTFSGASRVAAGSGIIIKARLVVNSATALLGCTFRLWIYNTSSGVTIPVDNAQFALLWADRAARIGYIDFGALITEGTGSDCCTYLNTDVRLPFTLSSGSDLFGVLEIVSGGTLTPASGQTVEAHLNILQD